VSNAPAQTGLIGRAITAIVLATLALVLVLGVADKIDARLVAWGEQTWPGYAMQLRTDPEPPLCDLETVRAQVETCVPDTPAGGGGVDDDPFASPGADDDPFADPAPAQPAVDDDPFADPAPPATDDDPFAAPATAAATPAVPCAAAKALLESCEIETATYTDSVTRLTSEVRTFRSIEGFFQALAAFPYRIHLLSIVLLLGGLQVTLLRQHIALVDPRSRREHITAQLGQLGAHGFLAASSFADWRVRSGLDVEVEHVELSLMWTVAFAALALVNLWHLVRPPQGLGEGGSVWRVLASIPLFAWMAVLSGIYFIAIEGHPSGQAIYLHKFAQYPGIYLAVALYVWAGMMLQFTQLAPRAFDVLRPWKLPAAILGFVVVVVAAVPTAYSGASGIFVIAAGAIIFEEMRRAGADRQQAIMTTAMSGSLGVVLEPCLVVVLIATLNKQVTTTELFDMGVWVFAGSAFVFLVAMLLINKDPLKPASPSEALPAMAKATLPLLPYVAVSVAVVVAFDWGLDTPLDERNAAQIIPIVLLALLIYERVRKRLPSLPKAVFQSTGEAAHHTGALLFLMVATVCLGGVVERMEIMALVPESLGSRFTTMGILVVLMVLIGMTMDAMGAVILVSVTLADVAYRNNIDPVHFWMMVLVAFELGYLTPPVALNQLLTRAVVGPEAIVPAEERTGSFLNRNRHILVPVLVMAAVLLLVAFVPLALY